MKITCSRANLLKGVNTVSKAVPSKTTMNILQCILLTASPNGIKMTANNMDMGIETVIEGEVNTPGDVALDARLFSEIIRKINESDVIIETLSESQVLISCEKSRFNIACQPADEFPALPLLDETNDIVLSEFTLKEAIRKTIFSIADSETNKIMTGELVEVHDDRMRVVSLDGHRISMKYMDLRNPGGRQKVIVPGKTLQEISRILSGEYEQDVFISFTQNHIMFRFEQTVVVSRLLEGEYFSVDRMISGDYETKVKINRKAFADCLDRATLLIKEGDKKPIIIDIQDEYMELKISSQIGEMDEIVSCDKEGRDLKIAFNPRFLIESLRVIDEEEVTLYLMNAKAPCIIKDEEVSYLYLILPVNFSA